ncbi:MAG TPA: hypothetical protein VGD40_21130 [Chryseosolibacter sp.]
MENIHFIPLLEWRILNNENEKSELRETYQIDDSYGIFGSDNNGNILVEHENKLFKIDHEDPTEKPYLLTDDFSGLKSLLSKLSQIQECSIETPLKEIRETKKNLVEIKKEIPKSLRDCIEDEIENLKELISDYTFYKSEEGKRYLSTEAYKKKLYVLLGKPLRYKYVEVEREFQTAVIKINGICADPTETLDELKRILSIIEPPFQTEIGTIISFEEYQKRRAAESKK